MKQLKELQDISPKPCRLLRVQETGKKGFYHYNATRQSLEHGPQSCPGRRFVLRRPPKEQPSSGVYCVCDSPRWTAPPGVSVWWLSILTIAHTRFFVLTLRDCLVTSWESRCGRERPTGEKTRLGIYIWLRPHVPKQFLSCIDINLWDHMSEIFHHWETAESSWWCFMCPTLGVKVWPEEDHVSGAHGTVRRNGCTSSYLYFWAWLHDCNG